MMKKMKNCDQCENCQPEEEKEYEEMPFMPPFAETHIENSHLFLYGEINPSTMLRLRISLQKMTEMLMHKAFIYDIEPPAIKLHINSPGGELFAALAMSDVIKKNKVKVETIVEGCAMSAGTFLSIVGSKRLIYPNSLMMIHQISTMAGGTAEDIQQEHENCQTIMESIKKLYLDNTKMTKKQLETFLKKDQYLTAEQALKLGLVDKII